MSRFRFRLALGAVLLAAAVVRVGYVVKQSVIDPGFAAPAMDGGRYWAWATRLAEGHGDPPGAYYLAPLYPHLLALMMRIFGAGFAAVYLAQHALTLLTALSLTVVARRRAGDVAGLATGICVVLYHPGLFFASRPLGETIAIALLALAILAAGMKERFGAPLSGFVAGLASLARPNLLAVPLLWGLARGARRDLRGALAILAGMAIPIAPVAIRNFSTSGHFVPISANGGITLYHGNGPGAAGVYTPPTGFSGDPAQQQSEATRIASLASGRKLDDVESDRYFARKAIEARRNDPVGTVVLLARRALLTFDNAEHGLDDAPALDENSWRFGAPLPFAVLFGLAVFGWACGEVVGLAIVGCLLTTLVFYVSSRYRLPLAILLCVPAGIGVARLVDVLFDRALASRHLRAGAAAVLAAALALLVPSASLARAENAAGLVNRAVALEHRGDIAGAEATVRRALAADPETPRGRFVLGSILETSGRSGDAEAAYRAAVARDPDDTDAAGNLAGMLIRRGAFDEAIAILRAALKSNPDLPVAWNNLVVALAAKGDRSGAAREAAAAAARGIALDAELLHTLETSP